MNKQENSVPSSVRQRGLRGHVIVFPTDVQQVCTILPPSLHETATWICVIFIGSSKPSREWLLTKAQPLIVRHDRIYAALLWLKNHNPRYADIVIDYEELKRIPEHDIVPAEVHVQAPSIAGDAIGSRYDQNEVLSEETSDDSALHNTVEHEQIFQRTIVSDIQGVEVASSQMAKAAVKHLKEGGGFLTIPHLPELVNEYEDEGLFPLLYPSLFPYGCGGFSSPNRKLPINFTTLYKHMLTTQDARFRKHYSFLFTVFNMQQRRDVCRSVKIKVMRTEFPVIARKLNSITSASLRTYILAENARNSGVPHPVTSADQQAINCLMREITVLSKDVAGSPGARVNMRNEIRAMIMTFGPPTFFITINPADVYNPIVRFLAGDEINLDNLDLAATPSYHEQASLIAKDPFVAAKFFHIVTQRFFDVFVQGHDSISPGPGLFGPSLAYYGVSEAQSRGSLHCHSLVWPAGALNPNQIRKKIMGDKNSDMCSRLIDYIDSIVFNHVPAIDCPPSGTEQDALGAQFTSKVHPCSTRSKGTDSTDAQRTIDRHHLVLKCQKHICQHTCFKYWKGPPEPKKCRFELLNREQVAHSYFSEDKEEFVYRCTDPSINNYNPYILESLRCNMDIKFIGTGGFAKALVYYLTNYVAKSALKMSVIYEAVQQAMGRLEADQLNNTEPINMDSSTDTERARKLLIKCANSMISKQELSAPQVAAYLMGYGDNYSSHKFHILYWSSIENYVNNICPLDKPKVHSNDEEGSTTPGDQTTDDAELILESDDSGQVVKKVNLLTDYIYRPVSFTDFCLWDFVRYCYKDRLTVPSTSAGTSSTTPQSLDGTQKNEYLTTRTSFLPEHPQHTSHILHKRRVPMIPLTIGPPIYRRDAPEYTEKHARLMLIFFKPWRRVVDLKDSPDQSWCNSLSMFYNVMPTYHASIIDNMQMIHECKDARDTHYAQRFGENEESHTSSDAAHNATEYVLPQISPSDDELNVDNIIVEDLQELAHIFSLKNTREIEDIEDALRNARLGNLVYTSMTSDHTIEHISSLSKPCSRRMTSQLLEAEDAWRTAWTDRKEMNKQSLQSITTEAEGNPSH